MTTALLLLLVSLAAIARANGDDDDDGACPACDGDSCQVFEDVKLNKLCVNEICVNGGVVVIGDGDPCTSDDIVDGEPVHVQIKYCCAEDNDCEEWLPGPCWLGTCSITGDGHGDCNYEQVPNCCSQTCDCPALPCKNVTCVANAPEQLTFSQQHKRYVPANPLQVGTTPGFCNYVDSDNGCCLNSGDCIGQCPSGTFGICDVSHTCLCVPEPNPNECTTDADCATDVNAKKECEEGCDDDKPPCYYYECDRGWCTCVFDPDRDFDGDGYCCKDDCDDHNPDIHAPIYCPIGNETEVNFDGDAFYLCGILVNKTCEVECPGGLTPIDQNDTMVINDHIVLVYNCDCCDRNSSGLDQPVTCAKDVNDNGVMAPGRNCTDFNCTQCYDNLCVLQPESGKVLSNNTAELDQLCKDGEGDDAYFYVVPPLAVGPPCDFCDDVENEASKLPILLCPVAYPNPEGPDFDPEFFNVCPRTLGDPENPVNGTTLEACCEFVLNQAPIVNTTSPDLAQYKACCASLRGTPLQDPPNYPTDFVCTELCQVPEQELPLVCDQCGCDNDWPSPCNNSTDITVACVLDEDHDGYFNCDNVTFVCFKNQGGPVPPDDEICQIELGDFALSWATAQPDSPAVDGSYCDCNDTLPNAHQLIVCGTDDDGDGALQCEGEPTCPENTPVPRAPVCTQVCAAECPEPFVLITQENCQPVNKKKKRSTLLADIKKVAARHGWHSDNRKRQPDEPPREDQVCTDRFCDNCDCCDSDAFAFPFSPYGGAVPNQCGSFDYNCNCHLISTVACDNAQNVSSNADVYDLGTIGADPSDSSSFAVGIRLLSDTGALPYAVTPPLVAYPDRLGYCGNDCETCSNMTTGISLESPNGGPDNRRRISIELQHSCTELVEFNSTQLDGDGNLEIVEPGQCFGFIEACSTPCDADNNCNPDCSICTKLWD